MVLAFFLDSKLSYGFSMLFAPGDPCYYGKSQENLESKEKLLKPSESLESKEKLLKPILNFLMVLAFFLDSKLSYGLSSIC
jgi:hypothetical protein